MDDAFIRRWARNRGMQVGERGRLPKNVEEAFYAEFPQYRPTTPITNPNGTCAECYNPTTAHRNWCTLTTTKEVPVTVTEYVTELPTEEEIASEAPETVESTPNAAPALSDATAMLGAALEALAANSTPAMDEPRVREIAEEVAVNAVSELVQPKIVHVHLRDREAVVFEERTHAEFENVLKLLARKRNVYMYGPPGTGKSTIALQAAKALGVPYGDISCEPTMPSSKLFGFIDANGVFRDPLFFKIFTEGGVWNWEEIDNGHPGITAAMNTALANGHCAFPHGIFAKSDKFYCTATANTHGTGATRQFVGRNQLDAATLDRFVEWEIGIDEEIEEVAVLAEISDTALGRKWLAQVREWRKNARDKNVQVVISPRGAMNGAVMLDEGFSWDQAAQACIFKGMDEGSRGKVEGKF